MENNTTFRLENKTRLYVVNINADSFDIVSGSLSGTVSKQRVTPMEPAAGRTVQQEITLTVAKLVNAKLKKGYELKKGDIKKLNAELERHQIVTVEMAKIKKQLDRTEKAFQKIAAVYETRKAAYDEAVAKLAELEAKLS